MKASAAILLSVVSAQSGMDNYEPPNSGGESATTYPSAQYVSSQQDHFDERNVNTWQQAYFANDTFWVPGSDAPVFLCIGGEGPALRGDAVVDSVHCSTAAEWLPQKGALMFALEHRFYGCHNTSACPVPFAQLLDDSWTRFLSSHQAVEDVANFVRSMNKEYGLTAQNKWVTWGGSYPGMLAGWSRLKHPELIHASVASSAPVLAQLAMPEYNDRVAAAYAVSNNGVGGSEACSEAIRKGHEMIGEMFKTADGQHGLEKQFNLRSGYLSEASAQRSFAGYGVANFPSQSNDLTCTGPACNIARICEIMIDESQGDEVARLAALRSARQGILPDHDDDDGKNFRLPAFWSYQTCTEFGFYSTCDTNSSCMFTRGLTTIDDYTSSCNRYGISPAQIEANIEKTNAHYGGLRPSGTDGELGTCVMWPNGEVDPWAGLSVLEAPSSDQPVLYVDGASHHAWTHASLATDQDSVVEARQLIRKQVDAFLAQGCDEAQGAVV